MSFEEINPLVYFGMGSLLQEVPIGSMCVDWNCNNLIVRTEYGNALVGGVEDFEPLPLATETNFELWYPLSYQKNEVYKDMDELYIVNEVQKAKKLGYLFLEDADEVDRHPIRIKYFEWCFRHNLPYMVAYKHLSKYRIILHLNPIRYGLLK